MLQRSFTAMTALALAGVVSIASASAQPRDKVVLMLNWYVYGEHAPFFYGKDKGIYEKAGIDLDIQEGRGSAVTVQAVGAGSATFGYADIGTMIKAASKGAPVEAVGILLQTSPMSVSCLADRNINKPSDLLGKTVAITPGDALSQVWPVFLKVNNVDKSKIKEVTGDAITKRNAVVNGQADCLLGNNNDQAPTIEETTGKAMHPVLFADFGVNLINAGVVANKDLIRNKPDLVKRFMRASIEAVEAASKNPEAAVDSMLKLDPKAGKQVTLLKSFKLTIPLYHTKATQSQPPFKVDPKDVDTTLDMLEKYGGVDAASAGKASDYYTLAFLP